MAVKEIYRFSCDAPGCDKKIEITADQREQVDVPEGWLDEQVEDTHLIGCCEVHICAAIVKEIGYEKVAEAMMSLQLPKKAEVPKPEPKSDVAQANITTIPIAPPKKDTQDPFKP